VQRQLHGRVRCGAVTLGVFRLELVEPSRCVFQFGCQRADEATNARQLALDFHPLRFDCL
jgi:hypothetical protein